ncbi:MAG: hypothetical protein GEV08_01545 [Acidimicrobiia bacterium]|nr:hypothetical protein [Acidimicrobiia bacterium]
MRRLHRLSYLLAPLVLLAPVATAAADEPGPPPADAGQAPAAGAVPVTAHLAAEPGLADPSPAAIESVVATGDPAVLLVTFWAGPPECSGLQRIEVDESAEQVRVGVHVGERRPGEPCTRIAVRYSATVTLQSPLGARPVVDADARPTVPSEYAAAAQAAWAAGDLRRLGTLMSPEAFALLAARPPTAEDDWQPLACDGAPGSTTCEWAGAEATLGVRVDNALAAQGGEAAIVEARFTPPPVESVAIWPYTTAEAAQNTQDQVDEGSSPW